MTDAPVPFRPAQDNSLLVYTFEIRFKLGNDAHNVRVRGSDSGQGTFLAAVGHLASAKLDGLALSLYPR